MTSRATAHAPGPEDAGPIPADLDPVRDEQFGYEQARHLLLRAGFGGTPAQIRTLAGWGARRAVDYLVDLEGPDTNDAAARFDPDAAVGLSEQEQRLYRLARRRRDEETLARLRLKRQQAKRDDRAQIRAMQRWWLERMIESPRPLEEKMTLFWHGHFASSYRKVENSAHMLMQNELFRAQALGSFAALLHRIIRDPAMLRYLDNDRSRAGAPNENLARELMELFALGEGRYTERDIKEGARALTGYTFRGNRFVFDADNHDRGVKTILGHRGPLDGDGFVRAILAQRSAAEFLARRLYHFFVRHPEETAGDERTERFIARLAGLLRSSGYELRPAVRALLRSRHFYDPRVMNHRIKSPAELVAGAVRTLRTPARDLGALVDAMAQMGQALFFPPSVAGWEGGRSWINTSTLFVRQNALNFLLTGVTPRGFADAGGSGEAFDPRPLVEPLAAIDPASARDPERVIGYLLRFTVGSAPAHARRSLRGFAETHGDEVSPDLVTGMLVLIAAMPEYQLT